MIVHKKTIEDPDQISQVKVSSLAIFVRYLWSRELIFRIVSKVMDVKMKQRPLQSILMKRWLSSVECTNPNSLPWAEWDARSIFKWSKAGLNPEFSFSKTGGLTKAKNPVYSIFAHIWQEEMDSCLSKGLNAKWNVNSQMKMYWLMDT